jgi:hypothetical protein
MPDLDTDLRSLVDSYVEATELAPEAVEAARLATVARLESSGAAAGGGLVAKIGLVVVVGGLVAWMAWPSPEQVEGAAGRGLATGKVAIEVDPPPSLRVPQLLVEPTHEVEPERRVRKPSARTDGESESNSLAAELELLRAARQALRSGNASKALALLADHAKRHPKSAFVEERSATEVMALCKLGQAEKARERARRFRAQFPHSSFEAGLIEACEDQAD